MMLKKCRVLVYRKMRAIFRRSLIDYHFRCGIDCKIKYNTDYICPKCVDWRGVLELIDKIDIKYAYYPDDTEKV